MLSISSRVLMKTRPVQDKRKTETRLMALPRAGRGAAAGTRPWAYPSLSPTPQPSKPRETGPAKLSPQPPSSSPADRSSPPTRRPRPLSTTGVDFNTSPLLLPSQQTLRVRPSDRSLPATAPLPDDPGRSHLSHADRPSQAHHGLSSIRRTGGHCLPASQAALGNECAVERAALPASFPWR